MEHDVKVAIAPAPAVDHGLDGDAHRQEVRKVPWAYEDA